jgi:hypothetical protein
VVSGSEARNWWEGRGVLAVIILLAAVPFIYPSVPPLVDLLGHMGRYRVELDLATSPDLQRYYAFRWAPIGNLGVDLLVYPLGKVIGLEPAVKLITMMVPALTVGSMLWVAHEVHHRIPPTAFFALPFVLGYPFLFGFLNFALSIALAFLAFGLWLHLARRRYFRLRAALFVPISFIVYFSHTFGWGLLGLMCYSAEAVRQHDEGRSWWKAGLGAVPHALVMAGPALMILMWREEVSKDMTREWFDWKRKWEWIYSALRDRWRPVDIGMLSIAGLVFAWALVSRRLTLSRNLAFSALVLAATFVLLPWKVFGSAYADMRLVPYIMAVMLLAVREKRDGLGRKAGLVAGVAVAFWGAKVAATSLSLGIAADEQAAALEALDHVPRGAALVTLVGEDCHDDWGLYRNSHIPSMAIVRRNAFANDQWAIEGANLLKVRYLIAGVFRTDSSQMVKPNDCRGRRRIWPIDKSLSHIPRDAFDYVWLVDAPPYDPALVADFERVWQGPGSTLYRILK